MFSRDRERASPFTVPRDFPASQIDDMPLSSRFRGQRLALRRWRAIVRALACPERWPSGLRRTPGTRVCVQAYRGFESHSLRQNATAGCECIGYWLLARLVQAECRSTSMPASPRALRFSIVLAAVANLAWPTALRNVLVAQAQDRPARGAPAGQIARTSNRGREDGHRGCRA